MLTKRGWLAVYAPTAVSEEKEVETVEGEFARKRRMMRGVFDEVVRDGMLVPRGYGPLTRSRSRAIGRCATPRRCCT